MCRLSLKKLDTGDYHLWLWCQGLLSYDLLYFPGFSVQLQHKQELLEIVYAHRILDWTFYFSQVVNMKTSLPSLVLIHSFATLQEENLTLFCYQIFHYQIGCLYLEQSWLNYKCGYIFTVTSEPLHSLFSTSKLSVNYTLAPTQSLRIFFKFPVFVISISSLKLYWKAPV